MKKKSHNIMTLIVEFMLHINLQNCIEIYTQILINFYFTVAISELQITYIHTYIHTYLHTYIHTD